MSHIQSGCRFSRCPNTTWDTCTALDFYLLRHPGTIKGTLCVERLCRGMYAASPAPRAAHIGFPPSAGTALFTAAVVWSQRRFWHSLLLGSHSRLAVRAAVAAAAQRLAPQRLVAAGVVGTECRLVHSSYLGACAAHAKTSALGQNQRR
eukprot:6180132-Pleurochrysis_carterae.AAC.2